MIIKVKNLGLDNVKLIKVDLFNDKRGSFLETYTESINSVLNINSNWIQDNESVSKKNVFRGLHFQKGKYAQSKLVRVSNGKILEVLIDLRKNSKTFKKHINFILDSRNLLLYLPKGIAHGFLTLNDNTIVNYKCDNTYDSNYESGINPFKSNLKINWGVNRNKILISDKDNLLPSLEKSYVF